MSLAGIGAAATAGIGAAGNALDFISGRRALTLPRAGELVGDVLAAVAVPVTVNFKTLSPLLTVFDLKSPVMFA